MATHHRRLVSETFDLNIKLGEGAHAFKVTIARDEYDVPRELAFVGRGKSGHQLDQFLVELGIQLSRCMQLRNPATGELL